MRYYHFCQIMFVDFLIADHLIIVITLIFQLRSRLTVFMSKVSIVLQGI